MNKRDSVGGEAVDDHERGDGEQGDAPVTHEQPTAVVQDMVILEGRNYVRAVVGDGDAGSECWHLQRLLHGDGTVSRSGSILEVGKFYGSAEMYGGGDTFFEIDVESLVVSSRGQKAIAWSFRPLKKGRKVPDTVEAPTAVLSERSENVEPYLRQVVIRWCTKNSGIIIILGGPLTRAPIKGIEREFSQDFGEVYQRGGFGRCVFDCIVNAVDRMAGRSAARNAALAVDGMNTHFENLGKVKKVLGDISVPVKSVPVKSDVEDLVKWLSEDAKGVFIVRLEQVGVVDYCVVVDTVDAIIIDSAEKYPIRLREDTLRKCGGDNANEARVVQVRQIMMRRS